MKPDTKDSLLLAALVAGEMVAVSKWADWMSKRREKNESRSR